MCEGAGRERWGLKGVHPTIGAYEGEIGEVPIEVYIARLQKAGTVGFSVYLSHHLDDDEYRALGDAIRTLEIAREPTKLIPATPGGEARAARTGGADGSP